MSFLYPHVLYALILPALLLIASGLLMRRRSRKWEELVSRDHVQELVVRPSVWKRLLTLTFGLLALCLLILALARPYSGTREVPTIHKGHNIMLAIDVSRSMLTRDVTPSRLERAKTAAFDLLDALPEDNFGLIIFSGEAHLLIPLTHDHSAVREAIEQLEFGWISYGGTNMKNVLQLALNTFKRDKGESTNALVILSDGEDTVNLDYNTALDARESKLIVIAAGIGTVNGDAIPDSSNPDGLYRDARGQHVISKLVLPK